MNAQEQKAFFDENGYVVVPDIISPADLEELRCMIDKVLDGTLKPELPEPDTGVPLDDFQIQWEPGMRDNPDIPRREKIRCVFHLGHTHPFFRHHVLRREITSVVENLIGFNPLLYTDQTFMKPAHHGSEVPFHQDSGYWPAVRPHGMLSCWLAIDDATVENGCMHFIPGSHRELIPHHEFQGVQQWGLLENQVDLSREVPVELKAGSASFHHSLTVHRSFPNNSDRSRRGLISIYMPADIQFVQPWPFQYGFHPIHELELAKL